MRNAVDDRVYQTSEEEIEILHTHLKSKFRRQAATSGRRVVVIGAGANVELSQANAIVHGLPRTWSTNKARTF